MSIRFPCQSCRKMLRLPEDKGGKSCRCPGCGAVQRVPPADELDDAEPATQIEDHPRDFQVRRVPPDDEPDDAEETAHLEELRRAFQRQEQSRRKPLVTIDRVLALVSAAWIALLVSGAEFVGQAAVPVSIALLAINFLISVWVWLRRARVVYFLSLVQLGLFGILFYTIGQHNGREHFAFDAPPSTWDWVQFTLAQALHAADVLDGLHEFHIDLQNITHRSTLIGVLLVFMHVSVDFFLIGLLIRWLAGIWEELTYRLPWLSHVGYFVENSWAAVTAPLREQRGCLVVFLLAFLGLFGAWAFHQQVAPRDWLLWPLDNALRTLDLGDMFQIFRWKLHGVEPSAVNAIIALLFRLVVGIFLARKIARFHFRHLRGLGKTSEAMVATFCGYDEALAQAAQRGLIQRGPEAFAAILQSNEAQHYSNVEKLVAIFRANEAHAHAFLLDALEDVKHGHHAACFLGQMGAATVPALVEKLSHSSLSARRNAAFALGELGQVALPALQECFSDADPLVRAGAAKALTWIHEQPAAVTRLLEQAIDDPVLDVRVAAIEAIGNCRTDHAKIAVRLAQLMASPQAKLRHAVGTAFIRLRKKGQAAIPVLWKLFADANPQQKHEVVKIFGHLRESAQSVAPQLCDALRAALDAGDTLLAKALVEALGEIGPAKVVLTPLSSALKHRDSSISQAAAYALATVPGAKAQAATVLAKALNDAGYLTGQAIVQALGNLGADARVAIAALKKKQSDPRLYDDLRALIQEVLGKIQK